MLWNVGNKYAGGRRAFYIYLYIFSNSLQNTEWKVLRKEDGRWMS